MRLLFALPGFHRYDRGAEVALLAVAEELATAGEDVTVAGSGDERSGVRYRFLRVPSVRRETFERFPKFPPLRNETAWEDATFAAGLLTRYDPARYDATITCSFPFTQWALRRPAPSSPAHIFVTQNGDWPARSNRSEFRFFGCDGLVCTNPDFFEVNSKTRKCALIPNGVDLQRFSAGPAERAAFGLPENQPVILMVSALIPSKRVADGIRAVAKLEGAFLAVAGDGPLREEIQGLADQLLPGRFKRLTVPAADMPRLYRSADVFLHLSMLESFGNVFLEAWASGLSIVAEDSSRLRWIVGNGHHLCKTTDREALVASLECALQSSGAIGMDGLERFAWPAVAAEYGRFIADVVNGRHTLSLRSKGLEKARPLAEPSDPPRSIGNKGPVFL